MHSVAASGQPSSASDSDASTQVLNLRLAVEASGEVIFMTDTAGTITYVNPAFVRVYGYEPSEVVGRETPRLLKSGLRSAEEYTDFWQQLKACQVVRGEFINRTKTGKLVHIDNSANPIVDDGRLVGFLAIQRDITERKATETALRQSEHRYRTLAEAAHDSIFIINRAGELEYANTVTMERFGIRSEDAIGKRLHDLFPQETADEIWRDVSTVFETRVRQYFEGRFKTAAGELWLGIWLVPMVEDGADPYSIMGVARDITEQKHLERQFLQAQKMEAIGQLTGGIAHDFNNLLTAIIGYSELILAAPGLAPEIAADIKEVRKAGERASRLTRQLLTFSRRQVTTLQALDLHEVVCELQKLLGRVINEDISLKIITGHPLEKVKADAGQIEQLIVNLVVNARDAMPQGGTLKVETANVDLDDQFVRRHAGAVPGRYVALSVQDSGCGMTLDVLAHVFEPFFTTKPAGKGTGLGLATVYGIVKQSGGYVVIDSELGTGTTVTAYFPVAHEEPTVLVPQCSRADAAGGTETILLVEDEAGLRTLMQRTLQQRGYIVLNAANVTEALDLAESHSGPIDLLLTDVVMPGLSGPDLAQRVVPLHSAIKVLYVSGFANVAQGGSLSRKAALLPKPFTPRLLAARVRECLDRPDVPNDVSRA